MKVLITGSEGRIGRRLAAIMNDRGFVLRGFDTRAVAAPITDRHAGDLRDLSAVRAAMRGVDAVIHLGAIPSDRGDGDAVMQVNVMGTWNVLQAAQENGVRRAVVFSSINAQGSVRGVRPTEYLPIDDDYPHHPMSPYQLSKHLVEEMCRSFSERHDMVTICLRPTWVTHEEHYAHDGFDSEEHIDKWRADFWAYVDVRDVCEAVLRCLYVDGLQHDCFLLAADDTSVRTPTAELLATYYPDVPWPRFDPATYLAGNPYRSLIDCSRATSRLGWKPKHSWRDAAILPGR